MPYMKKQKIFIGVAWPYVNGDLHIGHVAGYLLPADITARFYRLSGHEVLMVSGSDCFGTPITVEADKKGLTPEQVVDEYHPKNVRLFENLNLSFDLYTKTNTDNHRKITQNFLLAFWKKNLLEIKTEKQYYSESLDRFLPDRYVEGRCPHCKFEGARSDQCDNCGRLLNQDLENPISKIDSKPVELKETEHVFIKWNELQKPIEEYVNAQTGWRDWVKAEAMQWLTEGLRARAVTRDLDWGVEIPEEIAAKLTNSENKRIYVWFDAVIGYYSASLEWAEKTGSDWKPFWYEKDTTHYYFMGKDNLVFHTIFWPGQLMTFDNNLKLPDRPAINQYLNLEGKKFSKSRGIIIDTSEFIDKFSADALRFALTTVMPENSDANFTWGDFLNKNNDILVGHIGNYIHRTLHIYSGCDISTSEISDIVITKITDTLVASKIAIVESRFKDYLSEVQELSRFANEYFNQKKPWELKKNDTGRFIASGADLVILTYALAALLEPITPNAAHHYFEMVELGENQFWSVEVLKEHLVSIKSSIVLNPPSLLFPKFEQEEITT